MSIALQPAMPARTIETRGPTNAARRRPAVLTIPVDRGRVFARLGVLAAMTGAAIAITTTFLMATMMIIASNLAS